MNELCGNEFKLRDRYVCTEPKGHSGVHGCECPNPQFHQTWDDENGEWPVSSKAAEAEKCSKCGGELTDDEICIKCGNSAAEAPGGQDCDCVMEVDSSGKATVTHQAGCRYSKLYEAFRRACEQVWRCTDAPGQTLESTMQFYLAVPAAPSERADERKKFEQECRKRKGFSEDELHQYIHGMYLNSLVSAAWEGWQARARLSSQEGK